MTAQEIAIEAAGWAGAVMILAGYALVSAKRVAPDSLLYQGLNIAGAAGFIVNGVAHGAIPSAALNVLWIGIGVWTLWGARRRLAA